MRNSTKSSAAVHLLSSMETGRNAILFYDDDKTLDKFLFEYVKTGLQKGETVYYWTGIRTKEQAEKRMSLYGIDCDHYSRNGTLVFTSYDDMVLADGRLDLQSCHRKLFSMIKTGGKSKARLATESNWWLLADVFENGVEMEGTHDMMPQSASVVCTYNIADLMKYVNLYHLAKLMESHHDTLLETRGSTMLPVEFYSYLGKSVLNILEENFDHITLVRKKHSRFISELLAELQMRVGSDMHELQRKVEAILVQKLKLN
ncbi:MAG: MEDS domain-containing protein [Nitrososphaerales archaeon]